MEPELIKLKALPKPGQWISATVVAIIVAATLQSVATNPNFKWDVVWQWLFSKSMLVGVGYTLLLTVGSMVIGTVLALAMAVMRQSPNPILRGVAWFFIWFFRGTPVYTQLIFWSLLPTLYPQISVALPFTDVVFTEFKTVDYFTPMLIALVGLGLNEGAYLAEIIRAGLNSVDKGQWEAATALGMQRSLILRRIILPQTMRVIIPPLGNETISMLKTTSLVAAIPITLELTWVAKDKGQAAFTPVPFLIDAAIWYLFITSVLMVGQYFLERYYGRGFGAESVKKPFANRGISKRQQAILDAHTTKEDPFIEVTP